MSSVISWWSFTISFYLGVLKNCSPLHHIYVTPPSTHTHTSYEKNLAALEKLSSFGRFQIDPTVPPTVFASQTPLRPPPTHGSAIMCPPLNVYPPCSHPPLCVPASYLVPHWILCTQKMLNQLYLCSWENAMFQEHSCVLTQSTDLKVLWLIPWLFIYHCLVVMWTIIKNNTLKVPIIPDLHRNTQNLLYAVYKQWQLCNSLQTTQWWITILMTEHHFSLMYGTMQ